MIRPILALTGADWRSARTYRVRMALSVAGLVVSVVPVFYIARALQSTVARSIATEGHQYFAFILLGTFAVSLAGAAAGALPQAVSGGIASGFLESLLVTRASRPAVLVGLTTYSILWTLVRGLVMLTAGSLLGAALLWTALPSALLIMLLIVMVHWPIGLLGSALVLAFRTAGPLTGLALVGSSLLGGAYYPTSVLPEWARTISHVVPMTYGLRALRRVIIDGKSLLDVGPDLAALLGLGALLALVGTLAFRTALRSAMRAGTLSQY